MKLTRKLKKNYKIFQKQKSTGVESIKNKQNNEISNT